MSFLSRLRRLADPSGPPAGDDRAGGDHKAALGRAGEDAAATLLRDTDLKLESIAWESGLGNATNLCRLFKKRYGRTPGAWRQNH